MKKKVFLIFALLILFSVSFLSGKMYRGYEIKGSEKKETKVMSHISPISASVCALYPKSKRDNSKPKNNTEKNSQKKNEPSKTGKIAYLSFDDGPSISVTPKILDILKKYNIKATFFVIGDNLEAHPELSKRAVAEGHVIGNHTYDHNDKLIYSNPNILVDEYNKTHAIIRNILGVNNNIVRFPGGSRNRDVAFKNAVTKAGYHFYDWNCLTKDSEGPILSVPVLMANFKATYHGQKELIVLMHDSEPHLTTADALPLIIDFLKSQGYEFKTLS